MKTIKQQLNHSSIARRSSTFYASPIIKTLFDSIEEIVIIINQQKQLIFFNQSFINWLQPYPSESIFQALLGTPINFPRYLDKYFTGAYNEYFINQGIIRSIFDQLKQFDPIFNSPDFQKKSQANFSCLVQTSPFSLHEDKYLILFISESSQQKHHRLIERKFFHDIANSITCLKFGTECLENETDPSIIKDTLKELQAEINLLTEKINRQKMLLKAANQELISNPVEISAHTVIKQLIQQQQNNADTKKVTLKTTLPQDIRLKIDPNILLLVLGNIVKNAIEASTTKEIVKIGYVVNQNQINFLIYNQGYIPKKIQNQIFQPQLPNSPSTLGVGTHTIKLFSEQYLRGSVKFSSTKKGTVFTASYPITPKN